jgi:AcrR family transcriptional regulator
MNTDTERRTYRSALREDQAQATALRIVEAALRVLERGIAVLSIAAVAREAGVSVQTVYHHFGDKIGLVRAVSDHLDRASVGGEALPPADSPSGLAAHVRFVFPRLDGRNALMAPALAGPEGAALRKEWLADRSEMVRTALAEAESRMSPSDFDHLVAVVTILCTSQTLGVMHEYLGLSVDDAAGAVAWAIFKLSGENES